MKTHTLYVGAALLSGLLTISGAASADSKLLSTTAMPAGTPTAAAPPGFISFCYRFADQCVSSANDSGVVHLDATSQALLENVNNRVNGAIRLKDDMRHYDRAEYWTIPTDGYGSSKAYALTKRRDLISAGLPERALRIAIASTSGNTRHTVLTVVTDHGDVVLDNLTDTVEPWDHAGYRWVARQDSRGELGWELLDGATDNLLMEMSTEHEIVAQK
jgi:predicted transglutaminase-like cysteine proteinase